MIDKEAFWELSSVDIPAAQWNLINLTRVKASKVEGRFIRTSVALSVEDLIAISTCSFAFLFTSLEDAELTSEIALTVNVSYNVTSPDDFLESDLISELHKDSIPHLANAISVEAGRIVKSAGILKPFLADIQTIIDNIPTGEFKEAEEDVQAKS